MLVLVRILLEEQQLDEGLRDDHRPGKVLLCSSSVSSVTISFKLVNFLEASIVSFTVFHSHSSKYNDVCLEGVKQLEWSTNKGRCLPVGRSCHYWQGCIKM